jgi:hypothetical protein
VNILQGTKCNKKQSNETNLHISKEEKQNYKAKWRSLPLLKNKCCEGTKQKLEGVNPTRKVAARIFQHA